MSDRPRVVPFQLGCTIPSPVYVDANVLISAKIRGHALFAASRRFLATVLAQRAEVVVSMLTLDETWWALLRTWYQADHGVRLFNRDVTPAARIVAPYEASLRRVQRELERWPRVRLVAGADDPPEVLARRALDHLARLDLTPRDAFHLAIARSAGAAAIATADSDFDHLQQTGLDWSPVILRL